MREEMEVDGFRDGGGMRAEECGCLQTQRVYGG